MTLCVCVCVCVCAYRKRRNISVQKIWRFRHNPPKLKYWRILNLAVAYLVSMTLCTYAKILAVFNLAILCSIAKSPSKKLMYFQYFYFYGTLYLVTLRNTWKDKAHSSNILYIYTLYAICASLIACNIKFQLQVLLF